MRNAIKAKVGTFYKKAEWAVAQTVRHDRAGLVEDVCEHGVGHPNEVYLTFLDAAGTEMLGVHGCDGCCSGKGQFNQRKELKDEFERKTV